MIRQLKTSGYAAILIGSTILALTLGAQEAHALAPTCESLFEKSEPAASDLRARVTLDAATKQTREERFVKIAANRALYVDYLKAAPGKPTIVLVNGLTYRTGIWDRFVEALKGQGLGILRYDPVGMGKTMELTQGLHHPVTITEQVHDLNALLDALAIHEKIHLLGLSYGGGVAIEFTATYPSRVETLIPMAAYTAALPAQVKQIMAQIAWTRMWMPWDKRTDAELYSMYLKQTVYMTYPLSEPIVLENPWKLESVYNLAEGATSFNAEFFINQLPAGVLYQIDARKDQYIPPDIPQAFWNKVPAHIRASRMILDMSGHKIPEAFPIFAANYVKHIIARDPRLQDGKTWAGNPVLGDIHSGNVRIKID